MTNLLPLDTWRQYMGYHPFHFYGLVNSKMPVTSACNTLVWKYNWQQVDAAGRSEIETAIESAEERLAEYLGYSVAPHYVVKTLPWPKYLDAHQWRMGSGIGPSGLMLPVNIGEGYLQALGVETVILINTSAITISDADGDGVKDTFTASTPTTETDPNQIAVYFTAADQLNSPGVLTEQWRIRPVHVSISAGVVTVTGRLWLVVKPVKYEGIVTDPGQGFDPNDASNFVSSIIIADRTTDPDGQTVSTSQCTVLWETVPCDGWWGCCSGANNPLYNPNVNDPAAVGMAMGRVGVRDAKLGLVLPAQALYDTTTFQWRMTEWSTFREPDRVAIRYLAGWPLGDDGNMDRKWQVIVARLAAAELARPICACDAANQQLFHWQFDVSRAGGANSEQYSISPADLDNPLGTRRGQVWAWKQIKNLMTGNGTRVG